MTAGPAIALGLGTALSAEETRSLLVAYTFAAAAADGHELGSRVATVAVGAPARVDPFAPVVSAGSGGTAVLDAAAPDVQVAFPGDSAVLAGDSAIVFGTASDSVSGLASMRIRITRDDGVYWDGSGWSPLVAWNAVAESPNWAYDWSLEPGQSGEHDYDITVDAFDGVGRLGERSIVDVRVDNTAPAMTGVSASAASTLEVTFSERVETATVASSDFQAAGLTLSGATLLPGGTTVRLTFSGAAAGTRYSLAVAAGGVADAAGNGCAAASFEFVAPGVGREAGATRYDTAVAVSQATWASGECTNVVLATGEGFPDALAASGLAGTVRGPLLLTRGASLTSAVATELVRLGAEKVWIAGGEGAVSASVAASVAALGCEVERVAGADRYGTSAAIASRVAQLRGVGFAGTAFLARGDQFPDALAVSPAAYAKGFPVLLTRTAALPADTAAAVTSLGIGDVVVVGGTGAVSATAAA
ncbi:MAG: cell wall-binding repeat-containing protein [Actinobacteria bacterium]|nr:MAG: cell wall-binding repeat-containing protein [Actinomycetota bacterium]